MSRLHRPLATWIGDRISYRIWLSILREGAIDVEVRFGAPVEFNAQSSRKAVTRQMEGIVRKMVATRCAIRAAPQGDVKRLFFVAETG